MSQPWVRLFFWSIFLFMSVVLADNLKITVIPLSYRTAASLLPIIKPMMPKGTTIVGEKNQLIVKTTPENLSEIYELLKTLDKPAPILTIRIRQARQDDNLQDIDAGKVTVIETRSRGGESDVQSVQVMDGEMAFIQTGQSIQILKAIEKDSLKASESGVIAGIDYKEVNTGFYVLPRLQGERVLLSVSRHRDVLSREGNGNIDTEQFETRTIVPLDVWTPLGGVDHQTSHQKNVAVYSAGDVRQELSTIYVKVSISP